MGPDKVERVDEGKALVGLHEAPELLRISKSALCERIRAGMFPQPAAVLRCGRIWTKAQIERHARSYRPRSDRTPFRSLGKCVVEAERGPGR